MEVGLLIFITCVAGLAFGLLYFRFRDALSSFSPQRSASIPHAPAPTGSIDPRRPEPASERRAPPIADRSSESSNLTEDTLRLPWQEIVKGLAAIEMLDDEGRSAPLSKKRIAFLVGRRQEDVSPLIDEARGVELAIPHDPRFPESTKGGRPVASHLQTRKV